nr:DUF3488 and transglutaminase-like domain-containing protein [Streptomyces sp. SID5468]
MATPVTWYVQAALLVAVQAAVGALARRVPLGRALTVAAQALVSLLLMTLVFVPGQALLGLVPGPRALLAFGHLLTEGVQDVGQYAPPAPVTAGIRLLLVGSVVLFSLVVDVIAVTLRSAAPAGLPLLALYSVASGLNEGGGHWLWFLFTAAGYLVMLLAEGRDRLTRWGRVFGPAPRRTGFVPAGTGTAAPVRGGRRIGALAVGLALLVPAALPAMGAGLLTPDGAVRGLGRGGGTIAAVNPLVSLQSSLNQPQDQEVLRYRTTTDDAADMYLRILTLDQFDGTTWRASQRRVTDVPDTLPTPAGLGSAVQVAQVNTTFAAATGYVQTYLPMPYPAVRVKTGGSWRYEPEGRTLVGDHGQTTAGTRYQVTSLLVQPTARQLAEAPAPPARLRQEYTQVPANLPAEVRQTALRVTEGATTAYDRAVRLQQWFTTTGGFSYDTKVAEGSGPDAIVRFLHDKRGFCVHFSFTMAAMARTLGIPARVDVGFAPGTPQSDNSYLVGLKDAHAWPELYFEGVGWTRFEPTPSRGSTPDYTRPTTPSPGGQDPSGPRHGSGAVPAPGPSPSASCDGSGHPGRADCTGTTTVTVGMPSDGSWAGYALLGLVALLALALGAVPAVWRVRQRSVRLARAAGAAGAREAVLAAWRELVDTAWDLGATPDGAETPRRAAARVVRVFGLAGPAAESARRLGDAVEHVLYAPATPTVPDGLADDVRRACAALHAGADRRTRLRARLAPRSAARLGRRFAELRTAVAARCRAALATLRPSR